MAERRAAIVRAQSAPRVFRLLLSAYPRAWRRAHSEEVLAVLAERISSGSSWHSRCGDGLNLVLHGLAERALSTVRAFVRQTPLMKLFLTVSGGAIIALVVGIYLSVRPPSQAQILAALPATAEVNTVRCPPHLPGLAWNGGPDNATSRALGARLQPVPADRLLLCRYTSVTTVFRDAASGTGTLTGQRSITKQSTIDAVTNVLNGIPEPSRWGFLRVFDSSGSHSAPQPRPQDVTALIFGVGKSAVLVQLTDWNQPSRYPKDPDSYPQFDNGKLAPRSTLAAAELAWRTIPTLLAHG